MVLAGEDGEDGQKTGPWGLFFLTNLLRIPVGIPRERMAALGEPLPAARQPSLPI